MFGKKVQQKSQTCQGSHVVQIRPWPYSTLTRITVAIKLAQLVSGIIQSTRMILKLQALKLIQNFDILLNVFTVKCCNEAFLKNVRSTRFLFSL